MVSESDTGLPGLAEDYPLTKEQIADYRINGHVLLRQIASPAEVAAYRPILADAVEQHKKKIRPLEERDTYGKAFLQIGQLWKRSEGARKFVVARRFAKLAADLMEVDAARLYHDQALFKEAGGGHTPWHQDQFYWPLDTNHTITLWMPLVDASTEMGTMQLASGSNRDGFIGRLAISDKSEAVFKKYVLDKGFTVSPSGDMAAGDATFHSGWTLHSAPPNRTGRMREVMTIIYFADGVRLLKPEYEARQSDFNAFFSGMQPGDLAASPLTPILYSRADKPVSG